MRLKGVNAKGITVLSNPIKTLYPCNHKYGADATWSHCTDTQTALYPHVELLAFRYNLIMTAFISPYVGMVDVKATNDTGAIKHGIYFVGQRMKDPTYIGDFNSHLSFPLISDFWDSVWMDDSPSNQGHGFKPSVLLDLIPSEMAGQPKQAQTPLHGTNMYQLTNGRYGHDVENDIPGENDILTPFIEYNQEWFKDIFGYYPSAGSYYYGISSARYRLKDYFLAMRNSGTGAMLYGYSKKDNKALGTNEPFNYGTDYSMFMYATSRQWDMLGDKQVNMVTLQNTLREAITLDGWYNDFTHWHNVKAGDMEMFFSTQREVMDEGLGKVVPLDYGTAIEYLYIRQMAERIPLYQSGDKLVIAIQTKNRGGLNFKVFNTALSVELDTTGTILEGKEIEGIGDAGIIKKGVDQFIVEIPYNQRDGFHTIYLKESTNPVYLDLIKPIISSVTKTLNELNIITDKPTNVVVYQVPRNGDIFNATILFRNNTMDTLHTFNISDIDFSNKDIYVGAITKEQQSTLTDVYRW